ncbi:MAG: hypothetical protein ACRC5C_03370 [Bacilli bacterium]
MSKYIGSLSQLTEGDVFLSYVCRPPNYISQKPRFFVCFNKTETMLLIAGLTSPDESSSLLNYHELLTQDYSFFTKPSYLDRRKFIKVILEGNSTPAQSTVFKVIGQVSEATLEQIFDYEDEHQKYVYKLPQYDLLGLARTRGQA